MLRQWRGNVYYGARYYDPKISVWLSVDRYASKYPSLTPYSFSGNNPLMVIDINGDYLVGANTLSAKRMLTNINNSFRGEKFEALRGLFTLDNDGLTMQGIDKDAFNNAIKDLSTKEQALAKGYYMAINDEQIHTVEIVTSEEKLSENAIRVHGLGENSTGETIDNLGGGLNRITKEGSYSTIVKESVSESDDWINVTNGSQYSRSSTQAELQAHEIIGHGVGSYHGGSQSDAIRVTNLFWHVQGFGDTMYRNGSDHAGPTMDITQATSIPIFLMP